MFNKIAERSQVNNSIGVALFKIFATAYYQFLRMLQNDGLAIIIHQLYTQLQIGTFKRRKLKIGAWFFFMRV